MAGFRIGLTGGVASGKSAVDAAFAALGLSVADADVIARELVEPGQPALQAIVERFGNDVLNGEGRLDRPGLRTRIFGDAEAKSALEAILHPRIRAELESRTAAAHGELAIASIPLLAEGGGRDAYPWLDRILVIDVDVATQHARLMQRDGIDAALATRMIAAQASRAARCAIADDILRNEASLEALTARVAELHRFYVQLAREHGRA